MERTLTHLALVHFFMYKVCKYCKDNNNIDGIQSKLGISIGVDGNGNGWNKGLGIKTFFLGHDDSNRKQETKKKEVTRGRKGGGLREVQISHIVSSQHHQKEKHIIQKNRREEASSQLKEPPPSSLHPKAFSAHQPTPPTRNRTPPPPRPPPFLVILVIINLSRLSQPLNTRKRHIPLNRTTPRARLACIKLRRSTHALSVSLSYRRRMGIGRKGVQRGGGRGRTRVVAFPTTRRSWPSSMYGDRRVCWSAGR